MLIIHSQPSTMNIDAVSIIEKKFNPNTYIIINVNGIFFDSSELSADDALRIYAKIMATLEIL